MNVTILTGRMYNGAVHGWTDSQKDERTCFRGRLNFRLQSGEYEWIDVVCFRDNPASDANGLVGWLEENYLDSDGEDIGHGRAVEVMGSLKPTTKKKTITVPIKGGGKKEIPGVPYETFELLIDTASFVPTSQGEGGGRGRNNNIDAEEDFDIEDDADEELDEDMIEEEDDTPPARGRGGNNRSSSTGKGNSGSKANSGSRSGSSSRSNGNRSSSTGRGNSGGSRSDRRASGGSSSSSRSNSGTAGKRNSGTGAGKGKKDDDFFVE